MRGTPFSQTRRQQRHGRAWFSPLPSGLTWLYPPRPYHRRSRKLAKNLRNGRVAGQGHADRPPSPRTASPCTAGAQATGLTQPTLKTPRSRLSGCGRATTRSENLASSAPTFSGWPGRTTSWARSGTWPLETIAIDQANSQQAIQAWLADEHFKVPRTIEAAYANAHRAVCKITKAARKVRRRDIRLAEQRVRSYEPAQV